MAIPNYQPTQMLRKTLHLSKGQTQIGSGLLHSTLIPEMHQLFKQRKLGLELHQQANWDRGALRRPVATIH